MSDNKKVQSKTSITPSSPSASTQPGTAARSSSRSQSLSTAGKRVTILEEKDDEIESEKPKAPQGLTNQEMLAKLMASRRTSRASQSVDFRLHWEEFVRTVKVHEMLKCLEAEHRKLKILRRHAEDVLAQQAEREKEKEEGENKEKKRGSHDSITEEDAINAADEEPDGDGLDDIETENERIKKKKAQHKESEHKVEPKPKHVDGRRASTVSDANADISDEEAKEEKVVRSRNITDEEFEEIVALCADRSEQKALRETFMEKRNRDKYLHNASERRKMTYDFINSKFFKNFMLIVIIASTAGITLLTFETISLHFLFPIMMLDACVMGVFVLEAVLKISIYKEDYFKKMWNILDMIIVIVHFTEIGVDLITKTLALSYDINGLIYFKFLKSLRALRLLRIIKFLPSLQVIVSTIFQSFLSLGSIAVLMCLFIFVFAVMGKGLFSEVFPQKFGSLWSTIVTLFTLLTLDDWSDHLKYIELKIIKKQLQSEHYWMMFFYLFSYILIEYFVFLNLFVAVLVDNFQLSLAEAEVKQEKEEMKYDEMKTKIEERDQERKASAAQQLFMGDRIVGQGDQTKIGDGNPPRLSGNIRNSIFGIKVDKSPTYELPVEEYYGISPGCREAEFMESTLQNMTAIDFQRLIWKRRLTTLNTILDEATLTRADTYLKTKKQEEAEAQELEESSDDQDEDEYLKSLRRQEAMQAASVHQLF